MSKGAVNKRRRCCNGTSSASSAGKQPLVLHSDNGAMKSVTLLTKMYDLGVTPSRDGLGSATIIRTRSHCSGR